MTEAEVFASCLALSHCHFLDTPYEGDPFSDELNSGASNVCHYCTIDTLLSIIEKQCLRFTDVRFLNDSTEFLEIIPLIEHVLTNGNYSSSFKQFFLQPSIIEDLKSYRQSYSAIDDIHQEKITADNIYHLLLAFDEVYNAATEVEQKEFMRAFIERIDIFPKKQPDGNWIRNIVFAFPVPYNGKEIREFPLESQSTVECVLLMSKVQ